MCFKLIFSLLFIFPQSIWNLIKRYYSFLENVVINGEKDDNIKLKKKMLLYYMFNLIAYFVLLFIYNPHAPRVRCILYSFFTMIQVILLRTRTYKYLAWSFVICNFIYVNLATFNKDESLKVVLIALMLHNVVFLLPEMATVRLLYFGISLMSVDRAQKQLFIYLKEGNIPKLELILTDFYYTWPLMFLVNHSGAMYLVGSYQKVNQDNKEIKDQLTEANRKLLTANEQLSNTLIELEKKNQELKEALQARELFIASVSHELRNPLNAMIGNIELLLMDITNSQWLEMLETCKVCGEILLGLINNVLDVAKINAEKLELHYLPDNFYKIAEKVWKISTMRIKQKGLNGEMKISKNFPKYLEIDSHRLMQILLNLIGNSAKFTHHGFVKVVISWHENEDMANLKEPHPEFRHLSYQSQVVPENDQFRLSYYRSFEKRLELELESDIIAEEGNTSYEEKSLIFPVNPRFLDDIECLKYDSISLDETRIKVPTLHPSNNTISNQKKKGIIKIEIIDTGCGIAPNAIQRLFQPFTQADSSITRRFGGTGLGLYITQQLITKMGGQIHVYSEENKGSNFCVLIPAQTITAKETKEKLQEEILFTGGKHHKTSEFLDLNNNDIQVDRPYYALVVDDGPSNQLIISSYLQRLNIRSDIASNGKEAVDLFHTKGFDYYTFITMDLQMPVMDGLTAMRIIRKLESDNGVSIPNRIPIIVLTGNCTDQERTECLRPDGNIQANYFYRKPFTYDECKNVVKSILHKKHVSCYSQHRTRRNRVLVVDDDPFNQKIMQGYLHKYGFECEVCGNGELALRKLANGEKYDAILMDCEMPQMDGYTAAQHIKGRYPEILIIGVTGNTEGKCLTKALQSGMKFVETKPVDFKKIITLLS